MYCLSKKHKKQYQLKNTQTKLSYVLLISPEITCKAVKCACPPVRPSVRLYSVIIFKTLKLRYRWAEVGEGK